MVKNNMAPGGIVWVLLVGNYLDATRVRGQAVNPRFKVEC